jgi:hypothetical protein
MLLALSHVRHCTELSSLPSNTSDIMERCFTGAFFPLDIPLCGEPGTETELELAVLGPPTGVPIEVIAGDDTLPELE